MQLPENSASTDSDTPRNRSPLRFSLLVFVLSVPFWVIGAVTDVQLLEGLPISGLMFFCPVIAASILVYRERTIVGVIELLKRSVDYGRIKPRIWYAPALLLVPGVIVLTYGLIFSIGLSLPNPSLQLPVLAASVMFFAFVIAALCEELGWSGYAIDPMQTRWNTFTASILLGLVCATWHFVPLMQGGRSATWIAWWCLSTVAIRVLIVWLYNNAGKSVFVAALFHAVVNVGFYVFPSYDLRIYSLVIALVAVIVTVVWGPRTLSGHRARDRISRV